MVTLSSASPWMKTLELREWKCPAEAGVYNWSSPCLVWVFNFSCYTADFQDLTGPGSRVTSIVIVSFLPSEKREEH